MGYIAGGSRFSSYFMVPIYRFVFICVSANPCGNWANTVKTVCDLGLIDIPVVVFYMDNNNN